MRYCIFLLVILFVGSCSKTASVLETKTHGKLNENVSMRACDDMYLVCDVLEEANSKGIEMIEYDNGVPKQVYNSDDSSEIAIYTIPECSISIETPIRPVFECSINRRARIIIDNRHYRVDSMLYDSVYFSTRFGLSCVDRVKADSSIVLQFFNEINYIGHPYCAIVIIDKHMKIKCAQVVPCCSNKNLLEYDNGLYLYNIVSTEMYPTDGDTLKKIRCSDLATVRSWPLQVDTNSDKRFPGYWPISR